MADYKELLRRAVEALPENNGAQRRAVYEKARAALVGQLRAINPPLPARDITTHRLQLEDCIRQVEQESSEAVIASMGLQETAPRPVIDLARPEPKVEIKPEIKADPKPAAPKPPMPGAKPASIEDIIAAADRDGRAAQSKAPDIKPAEVKAAPPRPTEKPETKPRPEPEREKSNGRPVPSIVARAEAAKGQAAPTAFGIPADKPYDSSRRGPTIETRREPARPLARVNEPAAFGASSVAATPIAAAMSSVREVEVEPVAADPQSAIDRAIATLDREARGDAPAANGQAPAVNGAHAALYGDDEDEAPAASNGKGLMNGAFGTGRRVALKNTPDDGPAFRPAKPKPARGRAPESGFPRAQPENDRGMGAVTIFLVVFVLLLAGAGGAGYWAWQEGYINLDAMFGRGAPATAQVAPAQPTETASLPATGPGNTDTVAVADPASALKADERLPATDATSDGGAATEPSSALALQAPATAPATDARLATDGAAATTPSGTAVAAVDPASVAGSQSLLLEASDDGTTGAVPFSGTVDWSKSTDETGQPTLVGKANIPARNLSVDVLIRKNSDPSLPASHLMEINFTVTDTFIGGSIAGLPGVLLKNEELVQGAPLVGASARVVGNSFLFALSASAEDSTANVKLLTSRKWMDLALIYATGKRAIITLEKDDKAAQLFTEVFAAWDKTAAN